MRRVFTLMLALAAIDIFAQYEISGPALVCRDEVVTFQGATPGFIQERRWFIHSVSGKEVESTDIFISAMDNASFTFKNINLEGQYIVVRHILYCKTRFLGDCIKYEDIISELPVTFIKDLSGSTVISTLDNVCSSENSILQFTLSGHANGYAFNLLPASAGSGSEVSPGNYQINWNDSYGGAAQIEYVPYFRELSSGKTCTGTKYYDDLTVQKIPDKPSTPAISSSSLCQGTTASTLTTTCSGATRYQWEIPSEAGSISSNASDATIQWNASFYGSVGVRVRGVNCDAGPWSDYRMISVTQLPGEASLPEGAVSVYQGDVGVKYTSSCGGATRYEFVLSPQGAGTLTVSGASAYVSFSGSFSGVATLRARGVNCGYGGWSAEKNITVNKLPSLPNTPSGPTVICYNSESSSYSIAPVANATSYEWELTPSTTGRVTSVTTTVEVLWNQGQYGKRTIRVRGKIGTVTGSWSNPLEVEILPLVAAPAKPSGAADICQGSEGGQYTTSGCAGAVSYQWEIQPFEAGTLTENGKSVTILWSSSYAGVATLRVRGNNCTFGPWSESLVITVNPLPGVPITPLGDYQVCQGTTGSVFQVTKMDNTTGYQWVLTPENAGTIIESGNSSTVYWSSNFFGVARVRVRAMGCGYGEYSPEHEVLVRKTPTKPSTPTGENSLCQGTQMSYYTTAGGANIESYRWELFPTTAGFITEQGENAFVTWDKNFTGVASVKVKGIGCGESEYSSGYSISVNPLPLKPTRPMGSNQLCQGDKAKVYTTTFTQGAENYQWFITPESCGTITGAGTSVTVNLNEDFFGEMSVSVRGLSCGYGPLSEPCYVTVSPKPSMVSSLEVTSSVCQGQGQIPASAGIAEGAMGYRWSLEPEAAGSLSTQGNNAVVNLAPGFFGSLSVRVSGVNSCGEGPFKESLISVIETPQKPVITSDKMVYCRGESARLQAGQGNISWWSGGKEFAKGNAVTISDLKEDLRVTACNQNALGCSSISEEFIVCVDRVKSDFDANRLWIMPEEKVSFTSLSTGAASYEWSFGDGTTASTLENPTHYYFTQGSYTVTLQVTSANACRDTLKKSSYIVVSNTPSEVQESSLDRISAYPNPVTYGRLFVQVNAHQTPGDILISLRDLTGRVIIPELKARQKVSEIDLSTCTPGNYILRVEAQGEVIHKLIAVR